MKSLKNLKMGYSSFVLTIFIMLNLSVGMSCSGRFAKKDNLIELNRIYSGVYVTKKEIEIGNNQRLEMGKIVKIYVQSTSDSIKFYAYDHKEAREQSTGKCILFLTNEDFPEKEYSQEYVIKEANNLIEPYVEKKEKKK